MNINKVDYILSSDWHVRDDKPVCRTDNYREAQTKKIKFILSLAQKHKCPILTAGDLGNKPYWGDKLLNYFIDILDVYPDVKIYTICGQHDLPNHRLDKVDESGLGVLDGIYINVLTEKYQDIQPFSYGEKIKDTKSKILLMHSMVIKSQSEKLWEGQEANSAKKVLRALSNSNLIVTGDNHQSFAVQHEGRWLVNCGSMMRMTADQIGFRPRVYLWYAEDNLVEPVYLPIEKDVISREHIEEKQGRDERIEAYLEKLHKAGAIVKCEIGLHYETNIEEHFKKNRTRKRVVEKVWEALE